MPGYFSERLPENPEAVHAAYKITGPRKSWVLVRNEYNPHMLFPIGDGTGPSSMKIRGVSWFTDRDGTVRPAR